MEKISRIDPERADEKVRALLEDVHDRLGMVPNAMKVMANAPAVLRMALESERILNEGLLAPRLREQIALAVSEFNGSRYCISAHTALAGIAGLSEEEIEDARSGTSPDRRTESALVFARELVEKRGAIDKGRIDEMRRTGWQDGEIVEIIVHAALTTMFNYLNRAAGTEHDFPDPVP
ncbi:MAG: carboxymuconolactone decarboxylase family protein [Desulfobacterales bacterium]